MFLDRNVRYLDTCELSENQQPTFLEVIIATPSKDIRSIYGYVGDIRGIKGYVGFRVRAPKT